MVKVCVLASGSSGNCILVATPKTHLLVDAGLSRKETFQRLAAIGVDPASINAILITHEHTDHVAGVPAITKKLGVPVFASELTAQAIAGQEDAPAPEAFRAGQRLVIGDIEVDTFTIPHDAADPVGYCFRSQGVKVGIATDLGYVPDSLRFHLQGTHLLLLESNHDLEMLKVGPYPWAIKQRVMGRKGHLSNDVAAEFILDGMDASTATLVLGHISVHNNHPDLVRLTASQALERRGLKTRLVVSEHGRQSEVFQL